MVAVKAASSSCGLYFRRFKTAESDIRGRLRITRLAITAGFVVVGILRDLRTDVLRVFADSPFADLEAEWFPNVKFFRQCAFESIYAALVLNLRV